MKALVLAQRALGALILLAGSELTLDGLLRGEPTRIVWAVFALVVGGVLIVDTMLRRK